MGSGWKEFRQRRRDRKRKAAEKHYADGTTSLTEYQAERTWKTTQSGA